jgi:hypothetical protein
MCMFLCFFNLSRLFFTLDRFGQQVEGYIAPGGMFFYVFKYSRAAYVNPVSNELRLPMVHNYIIMYVRNW